MPFLSESDPQAAEANISSLVLSTMDIIPAELWQEAVASYFRGEYLAAVILGGACAEAAHKFKCRFTGMTTQNIHWKPLIGNSVAAGVIYSHVGNILHRIRTDYRNKWVHVDIDDISKGFPIPPGAGSRTATSPDEIETSPDEYTSILTSVTAQQEALNCLWLTAVALYHMYGGIEYIDEPSIP
ncbi:MAG: hypothetical protein ABSD41_12425 [Candidatus Bathyarchaeia archaeon]|jgi:hypothetical protein